MQLYKLTKTHTAHAGLILGIALLHIAAVNNYTENGRRAFDGNSTNSPTASQKPSGLTPQKTNLLQPLLKERVGFDFIS